MNTLYQDDTSATIVSFEADPSGLLLRGQATLAAELEYDLETMPKCFFDLGGRMGISRIEERWKKVLEDRQLRSLDIRLLTGKGVLRYFRLELMPVLRGGEATGNVTGLLTGMDRQHSLSVALEAAEERFGSIFDQCSDPILILSADLDVLSVNPAFEQQTGLNNESFVQGEAQWIDGLYEDEVATICAAAERCMEENSTGRVEGRLREGGDYFWYDFNFSAMHDEANEVKGVLCIARRIHDRKMQELKLRLQAEELGVQQASTEKLINRLRKILSSIADLPDNTTGVMEGVSSILSEVYPDSIIVLHSPLADEGIQDETEDFISSSLHRHLLQSHAPYFSNALSEDGSFGKDAFVRRMGFESFLGAPLLDSRGKFRGTLAIFNVKPDMYSISDMEAMAFISLLLAGRLRGLALHAERRDLENHLNQSQKMEAVGKLAGGIAHEFNNILSGILGYSSFLASQAELGSTLQQNLLLIQKSAEHASTLTRQLLTFSRSSHVQKKPLQVNELIRETSDMLSHTLSKKVTFNLELQDRLPLVQGSEGQLIQVLMNLCINAGDAFGEGAGEITMHTQMRELEAQEKRLLEEGDLAEGAYVMVSVEDNGSGMSKEVVAHAFEPFYTTKGERQGTGLGLSIVYGIVNSHKGHIHLHSEEGIGTRFTIFLPADQSESIAKPNAVKNSGGDERLLVVDDDRIIGTMIKATLGDLGYQVDAVSSGASALERLAEDPDYALVLLDVIMPEKDGMEVYAELQKVAPQMPVIVMSGFATEERYRYLVEEKQLPFIEKPFKPSSLAPLVRQVIDQSS